MILIDIPLPQNCDECPMRHWIENGSYEGMMMCSGLEFRESNNLPKGYFIRDQHADERPADCPIYPANVEIVGSEKDVQPS